MIIDGDAWYKDSKLQVEWLLTKYNFLKTESRKIGNCNWPFMICEHCKEFESDISKYSRNGVVSMVGDIQTEYLTECKL